MRVVVASESETVCVCVDVGREMLGKCAAPLMPLDLVACTDCANKVVRMMDVVYYHYPTRLYEFYIPRVGGLGGLRYESGALQHECR
jgi:hypothetical protein